MGLDVDDSGSSYSFGSKVYARLLEQLCGDGSESKHLPEVEAGIVALGDVIEQLPEPFTERHLLDAVGDALHQFVEGTLAVGRNSGQHPLNFLIDDRRRARVSCIRAAA